MHTKSLELGLPARLTRRYSLIARSLSTLFLVHKVHYYLRLYSVAGDSLRRKSRSLAVVTASLLNVQAWSLIFWDGPLKKLDFHPHILAVSVSI